MICNEMYCRNTSHAVLLPILAHQSIKLNITADKWQLADSSTCRITESYMFSSYISCM